MTAASRASTCQRNMADPCEDIGLRVTYAPCGRPAPYLVDPDSAKAWRACERHAYEVARDELRVQDADGADVAPCLDDEHDGHLLCSGGLAS